MKVTSTLIFVIMTRYYHIGSQWDEFPCRCGQEDRAVKETWEKHGQTEWRCDLAWGGYWKFMFIDSLIGYTCPSQLYSLLSVKPLTFVDVVWYFLIMCLCDVFSLIITEPHTDQIHGSDEENDPLKTHLLIVTLIVVSLNCVGFHSLVFVEPCIKQCCWSIPSINTNINKD